jgi:hypothetical protein
MNERDIGELVEHVAALGGGFRLLPSGSVETFVPREGGGWGKRTTKRRTAEAWADLLHRALEAAIDAPPQE